MEWIAPWPSEARPTVLEDRKILRLHPGTQISETRKLEDRPTILEDRQLLILHPGNLTSETRELGATVTSRKDRRPPLGDLGKLEIRLWQPPWIPRDPSRAVCQARVSREVPFLPYPPARNRERLFQYQYKHLFKDIRRARQPPPHLHGKSCGKQYLRR